MKTIKLSIKNKKETKNEIRSLIEVKINKNTNITEFANLLRRSVIKESKRGE